MNISSDIPIWKFHLYQRGLTDDQIDWFAIKPGKVNFSAPLPGRTSHNFFFETLDPDQEHLAEGWVYPIYYPHIDQTSYRFKRFPGNEGMKVLSLVSEKLPSGTHPPFYVPHKEAFEALKREIANKNGDIFGMEGEPDVWATHVVGLHHVTSFFGCKNVPDKIHEYLEWMGVNRIIYISDNDDAGKKAAEKLHDLTYFGLIEYTGYATPPTVNDIQVSDTTDVLKALGYDRSSFEVYVTETLPKYEMTFEEPRPKRFQGSDTVKTDRGQYDIQGILNEFIPMVEEMNGGIKLHANADGWTQNIKCLLHDDHEHEDEGKLGFGINLNSGACYCFKRDESASIVSVAETHGVDISQYRLDRFRPEPPADWHTSRDPVSVSQLAQSVPIAEGSNYLDQAKTQVTIVDYTGVDPSLFVKKRKDVMQEEIKRAKGEAIDLQSYSIRQPLDHPHLISLGGYAEQLAAGKLIEIIASTGGGKTTVMKTMNNVLNQNGTHTLTWSVEFDENEHGKKDIQMVSGINAVKSMKNDQYWIERLTEGSEVQFGEAFSEAEQETYIQGAQEILSWKGESYQVTKFGKDIFDVLRMMDIAYDYALMDGNEIQVVFFDYAQLMQKPASMRDFDVNDTVQAFKEWCNKHGEYVSPIDGQVRNRRKVVGVVTSQATKQATKAVRQKEQEYLRVEDAMVLRSDWFNLVFSLKWGDEFGVDSVYGPWREYLIYVVKNSQGAMYDEEEQKGVAKFRFMFRNMKLSWRKSQGRVSNTPAPYQSPSLQQHTDEIVKRYEKEIVAENVMDDNQEGSNHNTGETPESQRRDEGEATVEEPIADGSVDDLLESESPNQDEGLAEDDFWDDFDEYMETGVVNSLSDVEDRLVFRPDEILHDVDEDDDGDEIIDEDVSTSVSDEIHEFEKPNGLTLYMDDDF